MTRFGDFQPLCTNVPSYPWCNLFYREVRFPFFISTYRFPTHTYSFNILPLPPSSVHPLTQRPRPWASIQNVASRAQALVIPLATSPISSLALSALSSPFGSSIAVTTAKPLSARPSSLLQISAKNPTLLGRVELRAFLIVYLFTLPLQLVTTGSFLQQGTTPLVVFTAIHAGAVAALFWTLLGNAIIATQVVEDGTPASLIVRPIFLSYQY